MRSLQYIVNDVDVSACGATHNREVTMCASHSELLPLVTASTPVSSNNSSTPSVAAHEPLSRIGVGTTNCNADTHKTQGAMNTIQDHNVRYTWSVIMLHALYYSLSLLRSSNVNLVETNIE